MPYCTQCGTPVPAKARFCGSCGAKLTIEPSEQKPASPDASAKARSVKDICDAGQWLERPLSTVPVSSVPWLQKRLMLAGSVVKGEDVHNGPPTFWMDKLAPTLLGSVSGVVFKVAVLIDSQSHAEAVEALTRAAHTVSAKLGNGRQMSESVFSWDSSDGNVVVQYVSAAGARRVMLVLTSDIVRQFQSR